MSRPRLEWLDALRGFAALVVCLHHFMPTIVGINAYDIVLSHFEFGKYAVLLFFLVSGYVIPMSLERHGSLRRFWIGRIFRIYPAYLLSGALCAATLVAISTNASSDLTGHPVTAAVAHLAMVPEMLGIPSAVAVYWTLGYETFFYLIISGLFVFGIHRLSVLWGCILAGSALICCGASYYGGWTLDQSSRPIATFVLVSLIFGSVAAFLRGGIAYQKAAGIVGIGMVIIAAVQGNIWAQFEPKQSWEALAFLAVMFSGSIFYRAERRLVDRTTAGLALAAIGICLLASQFISYYYRGSFAQGLHSLVAEQWLFTDLATITTFILAYALRKFKIPRSLVGLGKISFSLYLFHFFVVAAIRYALPNVTTLPPWQRVIVFIIYISINLTIARLLYRLIERPGQQLGRRLAEPRDDYARSSHTAPRILRLPSQKAPTSH